MNKKSNSKKGCLKIIISVFIIVVIIPSISFAGCMLYYDYDKTLLFEMTTSQGYEVTVYQIGHQMFTGYHAIRIFVDGKALLAFSTMDTGGYNEHLKTYKSEDITCTADTSTDFNLEFRYRDRGSCQFYFSSDFKEIKKATCWDLEVLDEDAVCYGYSPYGK